MAYENTLIYYFTGTGNSYRVASWLGREISNRGGTSNLVPLNEKKSVLRGHDLVGVVFPTHGFTAPWQVIRFILGLPNGQRCHAFVTATRAGTRLWEHSIPGMEGTAGYLIAFLLYCKGYSVRGVTGLDMPSNWIALHSGINRTNATAIMQRTRLTARDFISQILSGNHRFNGGIPFLIGLALWKISLSYLLLGRFFLAKLSFASAQCDGCGLCAAGCPVHAIIMAGRDKRRPYWTFACESCMRCMAYCPKQAVQSSHSLAFILYLLATFPAAAYVFQMGAESALWLPGYLEDVLQYSYFLLSLYLAYRIFTLVLRVPIINKFFVYTTLTHIYRRYHAPEVELAQIMKPEHLIGRQKDKG